MTYIREWRKDKLIIPLLFILVCILSCEQQDDASPIFIQIIPDQAIVSTISGNKLVYNITVKAQSELTKFSVSQTDKDFGVRIVFDTLIENKVFEYIYIYDVPQVKDSTEVLLTFLAETLNDKQSLTRRVRILPNDNLLQETTGHILYSAQSNREYAFNLNYLSAIYPKDYDESDLHFQDNSIDTINGNQLSREWISPAGYHFVRFEGMKYAEATETMVQDAYNYGTHLTRIQNITDDDIIIIGEGADALAAMLIVQVIDVDSTLNDKYLFNIKLVE